jgi:hypothetical protein
MESMFGSSTSSHDVTRVKTMRWPASLRLGHTTQLIGRAIQLSPTGLGLLLDRPVRESEIGLVRVDAFVAGNPVRLQARTSVVCCTCVGMDGFRISLRFLDLDEDAHNAIDTLLRAR